MKIAKRPQDVLVTYSLGSCLGLAAWDPENRIGGLIHCLLPTSRTDALRAQQNPFMYVNIGVPAMIRKLLTLNVDRNRLILKAAGCARMLNVQNKFDTGLKNFAALEDILAKNNAKLTAHDVGGTIPRTMYLHLDTGKVFISSCGKRWEI